MTREQALECIAGLRARYPAGRVMSQDSINAYAEEIEEFRAPPVVAAIRTLTRASEHFPTIAALRGAIFGELRALREGQKKATPGWRLERIANWQCDLENTRMQPASRAVSLQNLQDLVPPITQDEWDAAWHLADEWHKAHIASCRKAHQPEPAPRPKRQHLIAPFKSYAGDRPTEGEGAYRPPRGEAAALPATLTRVVAAAVAMLREPGEDG